MKRVKAACICQTLHFQLKEDIPHELAVTLCQQDFAHYKSQMERSGTQYRIVEQIPQSDGSILVKVMKQYNQMPVGNYLD